MNINTIYLWSLFSFSESDMHYSTVYIYFCPSRMCGCSCKSTINRLKKVQLHISACMKLEKHVSVETSIMEPSSDARSLLLLQMHNCTNFQWVQVQTMPTMNNILPGAHIFWAPSNTGGLCYHGYHCFTIHHCTNSTLLCT